LAFLFLRKEFQGTLWGIRFFERFHLRSARRLLIQSFPVFAASGLNVLLLYIDRFFVFHFLGLRETGIYTILWSISNSINTLISSGVIQSFYPRLIKTSFPSVEFRTQFLQMVKGTCLGSVVGVIFTGLIILLLTNIDKFIELPFSTGLGILFIVSGGSRVVADAFFYGAYATSNDVGLLKSLTIGAVTSVVMSCFLIYHTLLYGAVASQLIQSILLIILVNSFVLKIGHRR
jgi:O-antigen/teichoic acid export membrane protein